MNINSSYSNNFKKEKALPLNKRFEISTFFIILFYIISSLTVGSFIKAESIRDNNVNLVIDTLDYKESPPKNFRKTTNLSAIKDNKNLNPKGKNKLFNKVL